MTTYSQDRSFRVDLRSEGTAMVRPYDAYVADAVGDKELEVTADNWDKAISGCIESIDDKPFPQYNQEPDLARNAVRAMLVNDMHHVLFMSIATFREGVFEGEAVDPSTGKATPCRIQLLDDDGMPLEHFMPPKYPNGSDRTFEWEEPVPGAEGKTCKMSFTLLTGATRADIITGEDRNLNEELMARKPMWYNETVEILTDYNPKDRPPSWVSNAITTKIDEIDPVIQYTVTVGRGRTKFRIPLFGVPDFFLQGFI